MWNKLFIICFIVSGLLYAAEAAEKKSGGNLSGKERKALQKDLAVQAANFDSKVPFLSKDRINKVLLKDLYDGLLDVKLPNHVKDAKNNDKIPTYLKYRMMMFQCELLFKDPELPEVSHVQPGWFKSYFDKLKKFDDLVKNLDNAVSIRSEEAYLPAKAKLELYQEHVKKFLDQKPPKLSSEEWKAIRKKNALWRIQQFKKYQAEMYKQAMGISSAKGSANVNSSTAKKTTAKKSTAKKSKKKSSKKR